MDTRNLGIGIIFLIENTVGILGNVCLLSYYLVIYYKKHSVKPLDLIIMHLIMVNFLIILSKGMGNTMTAFELKHFFNNWSYQLFMYVLRVFRSMSIATTFLLSVFQAIIISPRNSCWNNLRFKSPKDIGLYISICWVLFIMVNVLLPLYVSIKLGRNITKETDFERNTVVDNDKITVSLYIGLFVFPELVFSVLITWSSSSMIVILLRHKHRVQYIHSNCAFHSNISESRATQSILARVFSFLAIYTLSAISHGCNALFSGQSWWLMKITIIISLCFPTLSPILLMSQSFHLFRLCSFLIKDR
ncbi:vomeronasal type-1 receptor 2-like isoform X1 [Cricetulus griseus]|uniref:vomeronasal type-1 receptor 2-like isoform X1 n=1 Tax=Cricetulus griseus TaxID=10029 RepID=UPI0004547987|nr:vomeronasal type-1 receptor 2-like isoform X1 [Cricetulus griseus]